MIQLLQGDALVRLRELPDCSVQCCVTSPPYWGLRDYGVAGQMGLETTPAEYLEKMTAVFAEVRRVLRDDGTAWVNMGDTYAVARGGTAMPAETLAGGLSGHGDIAANRGRESWYTAHRDPAAHGLKHKDLCGIPWRLALALQADGWYLRCDIIWAKPNPMPESVTDRPTKAHEYIFLLSKSERYFYDAEAVKEEAEWARWGKQTCKKDYRGISPIDMETLEKRRESGRNCRSVWAIPTHPYPEAHFATFPPALAERCIKAGTKHGDIVLDPFSGAGTTGLVAQRLGRSFIGIELNPEYVEMSRRRIQNDSPLFANIK